MEILSSSEISVLIQHEYGYIKLIRNVGAYTTI